MRIFYINTVYGYGSTGRIVKDLSKLVKDNGGQSKVAFGRGKSTDHDLIRIGTDIDTHLHGLKTRIFDRHGFGSTAATKKLIDQIRLYKPDLIHLHNLHGYYLNIEILFRYISESGIPVIWTIHDCWAFTGHCTHFDYIGCERWKECCGSCPQKQKYPASMLIDNSKKNFKNKKRLFTSTSNMTVITVSRWLQGIAENSFLNYHPVMTIYNGIDLTTFQPMVDSNVKEKYNPDHKFMILGVANNWEERKGLFDFYKLASILDQEFIIVLIGLSKKQIAKLPPNILGLERTSDIGELVSLYSCADVLFNPSVEETFGLVTAEAMACGTPVIAYNSTANPELIKDKCGYIINSGMIEDVVGAIMEIRKNNKSFYRKSCIDNVASNFNQHLQYLKYFDLYLQIMDGK